MSVAFQGLVRHNINRVSIRVHMYWPGAQLLLGVAGIRELYVVLYWLSPGLEVDCMRVRAIFEARFPDVPRLDSTNSSSNLRRLIERELLQSSSRTTTQKQAYNIYQIRHRTAGSIFQWRWYNSMELSHSWVTTCCSGTWECPQNSSNPKIHYHAHWYSLKNCLQPIISYTSWIQIFSSVPYSLISSVYIPPRHNFILTQNYKQNYSATSTTFPVAIHTHMLNVYLYVPMNDYG